jgi:hypothetical protein
MRDRDACVLHEFAIHKQRLEASVTDIGREHRDKQHSAREE